MGRQPLRDNCWFQQKALITLSIWCKFKKKCDFKHILNDFIHVYSPRAGTDNPLGTNFWCQQKALNTLPICCRFKNKLLCSPILYTFFFHVTPYVYSPGQGQTIHWGQNFDDNRKAFSLCLSVASFKIIYLKSDFIHILMILYMYIQL